MPASPGGSGRCSGPGSPQPRRRLCLAGTHRLDREPRSCLCRRTDVVEPGRARRGRRHSALLGRHHGADPRVAIRAAGLRRDRQGGHAGSGLHGRTSDRHRGRHPLRPAGRPVPRGHGVWAAAARRDCARRCRLPARPGRRHHSPRSLLGETAGGTGHVQMLLRVGYPDPAAGRLATPRRPVDDVLDIP